MALPPLPIPFQCYWPWKESNPSCFALDPKYIATRVFERADLPIVIASRTIDGIGRDAYLSEIARCLCKETGPRKSDSPIADNRRQQVRTLSSNQLFLGVFNLFEVTLYCKQNQARAPERSYLL
jgi:hypothetical protein